MSAKMKYAKKNGQYVHVDMVPSGLSCECTCPSCGEHVIARNLGRKNEHHFAHWHGGSCKYCHETQLHIMAKCLIEQAGQVLLPAVLDKEDGHELSCAHFVNVKKAVLEQRLHDIIPDVVVTLADGTTLIVEICVRHAVDRIKQSKIATQGLSAIEIRLGDLDPNIADEDILRNVMYDAERVEWIYNPELPELMRKRRYWEAVHKWDCPFCHSKLVTRTHTSRNGNPYRKIECSNHSCRFSLYEKRFAS